MVKNRKRILALVFIMVLPMCVFAQEGDISVELNGQVLAFDVPPQLINDRTLVPVRAIAESLNAKVDWINTTQTVVITTNTE